MYLLKIITSSAVKGYKEACIIFWIFIFFSKVYCISLKHNFKLTLSIPVSVSQVLSWTGCFDAIKFPHNVIVYKWSTIQYAATEFPFSVDLC